MGELARRAEDLDQEAIADQQVIEMWLNGRSRHTQRYYRRGVERFFSFVGRPLRSVSVPDVHDFAAHLRTQNLADGSQHGALSAVKSLFAFAKELGYVAVDVAVTLRLPGLRDTLNERILEEQDVVRLIVGEQDPRNRVILHVLYVSAVRREELAGLRWKHCIAAGGGGQITVFGKGAKTRTVLIPDPQVWASMMALKGSAGMDDPVFRSRRGRPLSASQIWRVFKIAAARAGLGDRVSPHWLRHCHATHALRRGVNLNVLQQNLGHSSVVTTYRYLHARPTETSAAFLPAIPTLPAAALPPPKPKTDPPALNSEAPG